METIGTETHAGHMPGEATRPRGLSVFLTVTAGQLISLFGSELTAFVLGVWVYQQTGSATAFSLMAFCAVVPGILISPIAGALVDRWDRRWAMILSDTGAGLGTAVLVLLAWSDHLEVGWIYLVLAVAACFEAFQFPAFSASVPLLVPKRHLTRANGLRELGGSMSSLLAPLSAGVMLAAIGLDGVFLVDLATFVAAVLILLAVRIPRPPSTQEEGGSGGSLLREAARGWLYIRRRSGLLALLTLFAAVNFTMGFVHVLLPPLVLSFSSAAALGTVMSIAGAGLLAGGMLMSVGPAPKHKVRTILICLFLQGAILFLGGVQPSVPLVACAAFVFSFCQPVILACNQSIWQVKVAPELQGRVFAIRRIAGWAFLPLAFLVAGPLADGVFEPLMTEGGALADSVGRWIGVGQGRGVGLLFIVLGFLTLVALAAAAAYPRLRNVERELPDALGDRPLPPQMPLTPEPGESHA